MKDKEKCFICNKDITNELPKTDVTGNHYCSDCYIDKCKTELKEKQIEEMAKDYYGYSIDLEEDCKFVAEEMYDKGHRKLTEDSVALSREEYEKYQSFKNGDYCATKCDIHELSFNQMNKISDLENENEKLKNEIKNPKEVLEDRERFRARNEELKGITEQLRQEIITLSQELVNSRKETAEKFAKGLIKIIREKDTYLDWDDVLQFAKEQFGVEIKE